MSAELETLPSAPPHYRAVSLWAVLSVACVLAALPVSLILPWPQSFFLVVAFAVIAMYLGRKAILKIRRMPDEYTGSLIAQVGIWGAAVLVMGFAVGRLVFGLNEVPHGDRVLDYAELEPDTNVKGGAAPNAALELSKNRTKVYIRGYVVPPPRGQSSGLTKFSICRNSDMCKFGMNLARPEDQIHIELTGDRTLNYTSSQIGVGGIFSVVEDRSPQPYYLIEADYIYH